VRISGNAKGESKKKSAGRHKVIGKKLPEPLKMKVKKVKRLRTMGKEERTGERAPELSLKGNRAAHTKQ